MKKNKMNEYDRVELIVQKEKYAKKGVHKGVDGWICNSRKINGQWLVCFDHTEGEYPILPVLEEGLKVIQ